MTLSLDLGKLPFEQGGVSTEGRGATLPFLLPECSLSSSSVSDPMLDTGETETNEKQLSYDGADG